MKSSFWKTALCLMLVLSFSVATAFAADRDKQRQETRQKTEQTLEKLYQVQPNARQAVENAAGYAVFNNTGFKLGFLGSGHGRGMAINNGSGREVFMRMKELQVGLGLGVKEFALVFVFDNDHAWNSFVDSGWEFGGQATAAATDGVGGDSLQGAVSVTEGVWMYQMTTKGLALELALGGTRYYKDSDLN